MVLENPSGDKGLILFDAKALGHLTLYTTELEGGLNSFRDTLMTFKIFARSGLGSMGVTQGTAHGPCMFFGVLDSTEYLSSLKQAIN